MPVRARVRSLSVTVLASAAALSLATPANAVVQPDHLQASGTDHDRLQRYDGGRLRAGRDVSFGQVPGKARRSWTRFEGAYGSSWAVWDHDTGVPLRIIGPGRDVPGAMSNPAVAERAAADLLADHLDLLAPGATWSDFVLVSNHLSGPPGEEIRSLGYAQTVGGVPVIDGQLSVRFKHDRLVLIASEAIPTRGVWIDPIVDARPGHDPVAAARGWVERDVAGRTAAASVVGQPAYLPLVTDAGVLALRRVLPVDVVRVGPDSRWTVYVDAVSGDPVARVQTLRFADVPVRFDIPERGPHAARVDTLARRLSVTVDGSPASTDAEGLLTVPNGGAQVGLSTQGARVAVSNQKGSDPTVLLSSDGSTPLLWSTSSEEFDDAALTTYVIAEDVKSYVQDIGSAGAVAWLDEQMPARVNLDNTCNAFYNDGRINFYVEGDGCANTGRLPDVIRHEFGHAIHDKSIIQGVGLFEGALSEGISDYLAATIVNDSGMGRGFRNDDDPLRELDPEDMEWRWPEHRGEVHNEGRIIGGTLWDLRKALVAEYGAAEGVQRTDEIWFEATRRAVDIPSMFPEALLVDDDDGDLSNGTPNGCLITDVFGDHGLYLPAVDVDGPAQALALQDGYEVSVRVQAPPVDCGIGASATLEWRLRDEPGTGGTIEMVDDGTAFKAQIPPAPEGSVVQYQAVVTHDNGTIQQLPYNQVDPWYEMFVGRVEEIYCTDFETDPLAEGWTTGADDPDDDEWTWGSPAGAGADPDAAFSGARAFGQDLGLDGTDGAYARNSYSYAIAPTIDVSGYDEVRLQYRRWLDVEDGMFDQARIIAGGEVIWENYVDPEEQGGQHHRDGEWRFHDIDVTDRVVDGELQIAFDLRADQGLHLGGWTLDDFCLVGYVGGTTCGNGQLEVGEACDDGNTQDGDACPSDCSEGEDLPGGDDGDGDGDGDDDVGDDDPMDGDTDGDLGLTGRDGSGCACDVCDDGRDGPRGLLAGLALLGLVGLRRRRAGR